MAHNGIAPSRPLAWTQLCTRPLRPGHDAREDAPACTMHALAGCQGPGLEFRSNLPTAQRVQARLSKCKLDSDSGPALIGTHLLHEEVVVHTLIGGMRLGFEHMLYTPQSPSQTHSTPEQPQAPTRAHLLHGVVDHALKACMGLGFEHRLHNSQ